MCRSTLSFGSTQPNSYRLLLGPFGRSERLRSVVQLVYLEEMTRCLAINNLNTKNSSVLTSSVFIALVYPPPTSSHLGTALGASSLSNPSSKESHHCGSMTLPSGTFECLGKSKATAIPSNPISTNIDGGIPGIMIKANSNATVEIRTSMSVFIFFINQGYHLTKVHDNLK